MKNVMFLLTVLLGLAACAPALETPVSSITPTIEVTLRATITVEPTVLPTETAEPTQIFPPTVSELSGDQLAEKNFVGSGFELQTEFQGIPVDLTVVTSKANLEQYDQTQGCMPNQEMVKYGASAEERMAEMVFLGHYVGYLRYSGLTETNYPFTQYTADLKAGADRSYTIWGPRLDGTDGEFMVNPLAPIEYVTTNATVDPDGNGKATALLADGSSLGYQQLENGGVRMIENIAGDNANYFNFCITSCQQMYYSILSLGVRLEFLQGHKQLIYPSNYPVTEAELSKIYGDLQIYHDFNGSVSWGLFAP